MSVTDYRRTRFACFFAYLAMSSVFVLPPMLLTTFRQMYGISFTLLGTLIVVNFCTQMVIDLVFTFFADRFNIRLTVRLMPLLTALGLCVYALFPTLFPQYAFAGLVLGTVIFSMAAGLCEVLLSPLVAAIPSANPQKDMSLLHSLYGWGVVSITLISTVYFALFGTENWVYLTLGLAVLPLIASVLFCLSPIPDMGLSTPEKGKTAIGKNKMIWLCVGCIFLGSCAENVMTNWISGYMEIALRIPKELGDILGLAGFALLLAVTRVLYAKFTPNISKVLFWGMAGAAVCYLVAGCVQNSLISFTACVLTGVCTAMLWPGTLILMEEAVPSAGVAAYALMAASGDFGSSVAPQLMGVVADQVAAHPAVISLSESLSVSPDEIGLKAGMLLAAVFPLLGVCLLAYIRKILHRSSKLSGAGKEE